MTTLDTLALLAVTVAPFVALVVAVLMKALDSAISNGLASLAGFVKRRFTVSIQITWRDPAYAFIQEWLREHPYAKRARNVKMIYDEKNKSFRTVPGHGLHWLWYGGAPLWIRYGAPEKSGATSVTEAVEQAIASSASTDKDEYTITMLSLGNKRLHQFMSEVAAQAFRTAGDDRIQVYTWTDGYWARGYPKRKRPLSKVYMPAAQKKLVVETVRKFLGDEKQYVEWGIPYRLGVQLDGVTGTGKTTLATALAGEFDKPIYCINLNSMSNDNTLLSAFHSIDYNGIALIEDIDSFQCVQRREGVVDEEDADGGEDEDTDEEAAPKKSGQPPQSKGGVTLSGLLNAVDGLGATEGRILIITTNDPSKLDPALVRAARVDLTVTIGPLGAAEVEEMFRNFFPAYEHLAHVVRRYAEVRPRRTAAVWQKTFIEHSSDPQRLADELGSAAPYRG